MSDETTVDEEHPSFGMIAAYRSSSSPPGMPLFDSDILHQHTVAVQIHTAARQRHLLHDWIRPRKQIIEVRMSEAQWASFVSSMNTSGVPCTLEWVNGEEIEGLPFAPRLEQSMKDTREAARRAFEEIEEAMVAYDALPNSPRGPKLEAWRTLQSRIRNAVPNVDYAGKVLAEHAENVVQKARADVEAMVTQRAAQLGIEPPTMAQLETGDDQ